MKLKEMMLRGLFAAMMVVVTSAPAVATQIWLNTCDGLGGMLEGDKCFYNFDFGGDFTSNFPLPLEVSYLIAETDSHGHHGLVFGLDVVVDSYTTWDGTVEYDVVVLDPTQKIHDIELGIFGQVTEGIISVAETAYDGTTIIGQADVCITDFILDPPCSLVDVVDLDYLVDVVHIQKDILISVLDGDAELNEVTQYISQVPEPASMLLTGIGLLGLAAFRKKRSGR